uniref:Uncharacterized protein n=1 Tax=Arundo donax TaxID=35708 RepID=A0A0A9FNX0_ARUDO
MYPCMLEYNAKLELLYDGFSRYKMNIKKFFEGKYAVFSNL